MDVWQATREVISAVAARTAYDPITALCVSSLGEAAVPITRDGTFVGPSILCMDERGAKYVAQLETAFGQERFYRINPNVLSPSYTLPKLFWLREHEPVMYERADYFLLWSDAVAMLLGCDPVTCNSLANRTLLFDLARNEWSSELLAWSGIPGAKLGPIVPGGATIGVVAASAAHELGLPTGVKVIAGGHDQCCNALGCGAIHAGDAVCGIGTFECIAPVYRDVAEPLDMLRLGLNIEHHVLPELYLSFLFNQSGALVKWYRDTFARAEARDRGDVYEQLAAEMPTEPTRLLVLPHFLPPMWPRYIADSAGVIVGLRTTTTRGEILKAIMESTTLYFVESVAALRALGINTTRFVTSGGGAKSDYWLQIKADVFGVPFERLCNTDGSVAGAAMLAGIATGLFADANEAVACCVRRDRTFVPNDRRHAQYREKHEHYRKIYPSLAPLLSELSGAASAKQ